MVLLEEGPGFLVISSVEALGERGKDLADELARLRRVRAARCHAGQADRAPQLQRCRSLQPGDLERAAKALLGALNDRTGQASSSLLLGARLAEQQLAADPPQLG